MNKFPLPILKCLSENGFEFGKSREEIFSTALFHRLLFTSTSGHVFSGDLVIDVYNENERKHFFLAESSNIIHEFLTD